MVVFFSRRDAEAEKLKQSRLKAIERHKAFIDAFAIGPDDARMKRCGITAWPLHDIAITNIVWWWHKRGRSVEGSVYCAMVVQ